MPFALFSPWIVKVKFLEPLNCQGLIYMDNIHVRSNSSPREWSYCCTVDAAAAAEEQVAVRIPGSSHHIPVRTRFAEGRVADKPAAAAAPEAAAQTSGTAAPSFYLFVSPAMCVAYSLERNGIDSTRLDCLQGQLQPRWKPMERKDERKLSPRPCAILGSLQFSRRVQALANPSVSCNLSS